MYVYNTLPYVSSLHRVRMINPPNLTVIRTLLTTYSNTTDIHQNLNPSIGHCTVYNEIVAASKYTHNMKIVKIVKRTRQ